MKKYLVILAALIPCAAPAEEPRPVHIVCTPQPAICTTFTGSTDARFEPLVQHLLVRQQLDSQPKGWNLLYVFVPNVTDTRTLEELQIRLLDQMLTREREKKEADAKPSETRAPAAAKP